MQQRKHEVADLARKNGYKPTNKKAYNSQEKCAMAWGDNKFPVNNTIGRSEIIGATLYSSPNYKATQYLDGRGKIVHYSTLAGIRTRSGYVITNSQDYAHGYAKVTRPPNSNATLPLSTLDSSRRINIYDIVDVYNYDEETFVVMNDGNEQTLSSLTA